MERIFDISFMKGIKRIFFLLPILAIIIAFSCPITGDTKQIISHKILNKSASAPDELLLSVEVELIDGRLPNENELEDLSNYLVKKEKKRDNISINFYLPGTKPGSDIYASAKHDSRIKERLLKLIFFQHLLSK